MDPSAERASAYLSLLQHDLKTLSSETKKKYVAVKASADHALSLLSNPALARNSDGLYTLLVSEDAIWRPFLCAVDGNNSDRIIACGLGYLHHLLAPRSSDPAAGDTPGLAPDNASVITTHLVSFAEASKEDALTQKALQALLALLPTIAHGSAAASLAASVLRVCLYAACTKNSDLAHSGASAARQIFTFALNRASSALSLPPCAAASAGVCACTLQDMPPDTTTADAEINLLVQLVHEVVANAPHAAPNPSTAAATIRAVAPRGALGSPPSHRKPPPAYVVGNPALRHVILELLATVVGPLHPVFSASSSIVTVVAACVPATCMTLIATTPTPTAAALVSDAAVVARGLRVAAGAVRNFAAAVAPSTAAEVAASLHELSGPDGPLPLPSWTGYPVASAGTNAGSSAPRAEGGATTASSYGVRVAALGGWRDWAGSPPFLLRLHNGRALRGVVRAVARLCIRTLAVCEKKEARAAEYGRSEKAVGKDSRVPRMRGICDVSAAVSATPTVACVVAYDCLHALVTGAAAIPSPARAAVLDELWVLAAEPIDPAVLSSFVDNDGPDVVVTALRTLQQLVHGCCLEGLEVARDGLLTRLSSMCFVNTATDARALQQAHYDGSAVARHQHQQHPRLNVPAVKALFTVVTALGDHLHGAWLTVIAALRTLAARLSDRATTASTDASDMELLKDLLNNVFVASRYMTSEAATHLLRALVVVVGEPPARPGAVSAASSSSAVPFGVSEFFAVMRVNVHRLGVFDSVLRDATVGPSAALYGENATPAAREATLSQFTEMIVWMATTSHQVQQAAAAAAAAAAAGPTDGSGAGVSSFAAGDGRAGGSSLTAAEGSSFSLRHSLTPTATASSHTPQSDCMTVEIANAVRGHVVTLLQLHELLAVGARTGHPPCVSLSSLVALVDGVVERAGDALPKSAWRAVLNTLAAAAAVAVGDTSSSRKGFGGAVAVSVMSGAAVDELLAARVLQTAELVARNHLSGMDASAVVRCVEVIGTFVSLRGRDGIRSALLAVRLLLEIADGATDAEAGPVETRGVGYDAADATVAHGVGGVDGSASAPRALVADVWAAILRVLSGGAADERPEVRDAALKTLATVAIAHGNEIPLAVWRGVVWPALLDALDAIESAAEAASHAPRTSSNTDSGPAAHLIGESEWRQWLDSHATALDAVARIAATRGSLFVQLGATAGTGGVGGGTQAAPDGVKAPPDGVTERRVSNAAPLPRSTERSAGVVLARCAVEPSVSGTSVSPVVGEVHTSPPTVAPPLPSAVAQVVAADAAGATHRVHLRVVGHLVRAMNSTSEGLRVTALTAAARLATTLAAVVAPAQSLFAQSVAPVGGVESGSGRRGTAGGEGDVVSSTHSVDEGSGDGHVSSVLCDGVWTVMFALTAAVDAAPLSLRSLREPPRVALATQSMGKGKQVSFGAKALQVGGDVAAAVALLPWATISGTTPPLARAVAMLQTLRDVIDAPETHDTFQHPPPQLISCAAAIQLFATAFPASRAPFQTEAGGTTTAAAAAEAGVLAAPSAFAGAVAPGAAPSPWVASIPAAVTAPFVVPQAAAFQTPQGGGSAASTGSVGGTVVELWEKALAALLIRIPSMSMVTQCIDETMAAAASSGGVDGASSPSSISATVALGIDSRMRAVAHPHTAAFLLRAAHDLVTHPCAPAAFRANALHSVLEACHAALLTRFVGDGRYGLWCYALVIVRSLALALSQNVAAASVKGVGTWSSVVGVVPWGGGWEIPSSSAEQALDSLHMCLNSFILRERLPPPASSGAHEAVVRLSPLNTAAGHAAADRVALQVLVEVLMRLPSTIPPRVMQLLTATVADAAATPHLAAAAVSALLQPFVDPTHPIAGGSSSHSPSLLDCASSGPAASAPTASLSPSDVLHARRLAAAFAPPLTALLPAFPRVTDVLERAVITAKAEGGATEEAAAAAAAAAAGSGGAPVAMTVAELQSQWVREFVRVPAPVGEGVVRARTLLLQPLLRRLVCEVRAAVRLVTGEVEGMRGGAVDPGVGGGVERDTAASATVALAASASVDAAPAKMRSTFNPLQPPSGSDSDGESASGVSEGATPPAVGTVLLDLLRGAAAVRVPEQAAQQAAAASLAACGVSLPTAAACSAVYGPGIVTVGVAAIAAPLTASPDPQVRATAAALITSAFATIGLKDTTLPS